MTQASFLHLVSDANNVHLERIDESTLLIDANYESEPLVPWYVPTANSGKAAIGLLRPVIVAQLRKENDIRRGLGLPEVWEIIPEDVGHSAAKKTLHVSFNAWLDSPAKRTAVMKELCERWRDEALFPDVCGPTRWRGEMSPVYARPFGLLDDYLAAGNLNHELEADWSKMDLVFEMERSACLLFGVVTYGVYMTIFREDEEGSVLVWVPKRATTKKTFPGYLDNTVAGGITGGMRPFECLVKESMEEASIGETVVRQQARLAGVGSYFFRTPRGWLRPEIQYIYELKIPSGGDSTPFQPKPLDGEVESFELLPLDHVVAKMRLRQFTTNGVLVLIDFLIRHGHLTTKNEPDLTEIVPRLHGWLDYAKW